MSNVTTLHPSQYHQARRVKNEADFLRLHSNLIRLAVERGDWDLVNYSTTLMKQRAEEMELAL
jgi:hypothetical protein